MKKAVFIVGIIMFVSSGAYAAGDATTGKAKFDTTCASCHGATGAGDGPASAALNPKPRNLQTATRTDAELKKIIKEGGAANGMAALMPAWGAVLSDGDVDNVIAYIRSLAKPGTAPAASPAKK